MHSAADALADCLSHVLCIQSDAYIKKEGLPPIYDGVELETRNVCRVCGDSMQRLRVLCVKCRRRPVVVSGGPPVINVCWQGSHPCLLNKKYWEDCVVAEKQFYSCRWALQRSQYIARVAAGIGKNGNVLLDDAGVDDWELWNEDVNAEFRLAGLGSTIEDEVRITALQWLRTIDCAIADTLGVPVTDGGVVGDVAARLASMISKSVAMTGDPMTAEMVMSIIHDIRSTTQTERVGNTLIDAGRLHTLVTTLVHGPSDEHVRSAITNGEVFDAFSVFELREMGDVPLKEMVVIPGNLYAVEQWRTSPEGLEFLSRVRRIADTLSNHTDHEYGPTAEISTEDLLPAPPWVNIAPRWRIRKDIQSVPRQGMYEERVYRLCGLVIQMLRSGDIPKATLSCEFVHRLCIAHVVRSSQMLEWARRQVEPAQLVMAFLRTQKHLEECGPFIEDEMRQAVAFLSPYSINEIATVVGRHFDDLKKHMVTRIHNNLPPIWKSRGYSEFLQHVIPPVLYRFAVSRGPSPLERRPSDILAMRGELLMTIPAVREWSAHPFEDLDLCTEDVRGKKKVVELLEQCKRNKVLARRKRSSTKMVWSLCASDLRMALSTVDF